jgi:hypothetical protein
MRDPCDSPSKCLTRGPADTSNKVNYKLELGDSSIRFSCYQHYHTGIHTLLVTVTVSKIHTPSFIICKELET